MLQLIHFKNDARQIMRDPIMTILLFAPLLLLIVFKLLVLLLPPFLNTTFGFDVAPYTPYILSFVLLVNSGMLGIVTGFMMLDERDGKIAELMEITPLGRSGYLVNRLSFTSILSFIYAFAGIYFLNLVALPLFAKALLSLLAAVYTAITGLLLFSWADDKVKGLTLAKAMNALVLFAFTDLLSLNWLTYLSWFFPPYWFTVIIKSPWSLSGIAAALIVHTGWLSLLIIRYWKREA